MFCTHCGKELLPSDKFCTGCGAPVDGDGYEQDTVLTEDTWIASAPYSEPYGPAPEKAKDPYNRQRPGRFNWGAFSLTLIWGIGNRCYITLLCLVPIVGIIMPFETIATATWKSLPKCKTRGTRRVSFALSLN